MNDIEKDKAFFVACFYWSGYEKWTVFQSFDTVYQWAEEFVQTYDPNKTWEDESFEEYMENFIKLKLL